MTTLRRYRRYRQADNNALIAPTGQRRWRSEVDALQEYRALALRQKEAAFIPPRRRQIYRRRHAHFRHSRYR